VPGKVFLFKTSGIFWRSAPLDQVPESPLGQAGSALCLSSGEIVWTTAWL
jgi:hypothetical protein